MTWILAVLLIVFVLGPIARAVGASIEKAGSRKAVKPPVDSEELRLLSEQVQQLSARVERLSREQTFMLALMDENPKLPDPSGVSGRSVREETTR